MSAIRLNHKDEQRPGVKKWTIDELEALRALGYVAE